MSHRKTNGLQDFYSRKVSGSTWSGAIKPCCNFQPHQQRQTNPNQLLNLADAECSWLTSNITCRFWILGEDEDWQEESGTFNFHLQLFFSSKYGSPERETDTIPWSLLSLKDTTTGFVARWVKESPTDGVIIHYSRLAPYLHLPIIHITSTIFPWAPSLPCSLACRWRRWRGDTTLTLCCPLLAGVCNCSLLSPHLKSCQWALESWDVITRTSKRQWRVNTYKDKIRLMEVAPVCSLGCFKSSLHLLYMMFD